MSSGTRSKSVRQRLAQSIRKTPKQPVLLPFGDIVVFGMERVGKTAIVHRFVNNYFTPNYTPTTTKQSYAVNALIECEKESADEKKKIVFKKSFKKSITGKSRPLKPATTMKRVLTVSNSKEGGNNSQAYEEGKAKGLKSLNFNLIDTTTEMVEMEPIMYEATIANAKGFLLVCSFDVEGSLDYIKGIYEDIIQKKCGADTPIILIANKSDIEERLWEEYEINELAARLKAKYCTSSVATKEGCEKMTEIMLNEINIFAEEEAFQNSLPEDYAYHDDEVDMGDY